MTRAQMMAAFDEVATDKRLNRAAAEAALATEPVPLPGGHLCMATGGSSGPLPRHPDTGKLRRVIPA